jgi:ABC-type Na+ transport system ATPase subunit NatA
VVDDKQLYLYFYGHVQFFGSGGPYRYLKLTGSFQKKCNDKIAQLREENKTIGYVSHYLDALRRLTSRCMLLERGKIIQIGDTPGVLETYMDRGEQSSRTANDKKT